MADEIEATPEQVAEAKSLGWAPKENWRGAPEKWVDAASFLAKGMGIHHVRDENKRLSADLGTTNSRLSALESALKAANTTIEALEASHADDVKEQVEAARTELREEIARASRDGDHEGLATATDKLTQLNAANADAGGTEDKTKQTQQTAPQLHPEVEQWAKDNPELFNNNRWRALATAIGAELRAANTPLRGYAFMDKVAEEVKKTRGGAAVRRAPSKVKGDNGGGGRGGAGGGGEKTYADLPADAKAACDKQAARLVGPNRAHKDQASWRASYAKQYFAE